MGEAKKNGLREIPKQTHTGVILPGALNMKCGVLEDGRHIIVAKATASLVGMRTAMLGRQIGAEEVVNKEAVFSLPANVKPFAPNGFEVVNKVIPFRSLETGRVEYGYDAALITAICAAFLNARKAGKLRPNQMPIAANCEAVLLASANTGVHGMIGEATGYQKVRPDGYLQGVFADGYKVQQWQLTYEPLFWAEVKRLYGYNQNQCGRLLNNIIYSRAVRGMLEVLQKLNPVMGNGRRRFCHHQFLSRNLGHPFLKSYIVGVTMIMHGSLDRAAFEKKMDFFHPIHGEPQHLLPMDGARFSVDS